MQNFNISYSFKLPPEEAPKLGKCIAVVLVSFFMNVIFIVFGIVRFVGIENYNAYNILFFIFLLSLGIMFVAVTIFFIIKYVFITVTKAGYKQMPPFFRTISMILAERYANDDKFHEKINKTLDFDSAFNKAYDKNTPWIIKKAAGFFIKQLPFVDFLKKLSPDINNKDLRAVSESIYTQMDDYIVNVLFVKNNLKWAFLLFPANIAVQIILLLLLK